MPLSLDAALNHPSKAFPTIHVAGTNGKGSVATKIASALQHSGLRVGLYTSPHLFHFQERIVINEECITEEEIELGLEKIFALPIRGASFFELTTALGFDYFRNKGVDFAVIETGLGGRLDATNIIEPMLTVITSISKEHAHILGSELEEIAAEKAGIIKPRVPLILGPKAQFRAIFEKAKALNAPVFVSEKTSPFYDEENSAIAELALKQLPALSQEAIEAGCRRRPPCRFERIGNTLFDVAHNPGAIASLIHALKTQYGQEKYRFLVGFSKDKEYGKCLELIAPVATHIHLVQADTQRAASVEEMSEALNKPHLTSCHPSVEEGFKTAQSESQEELLVVCGSFYFYNSLRSHFKFKKN